MKHSPADFGAHVLGLLKNRGPTGPTGPKQVKPFNSDDKIGTTGKTMVGPLARDWSHPIPVSGTNKTIDNQLLIDGGTTGTTGTTILEQGPDAPVSGGSPAKWHAILAELEGKNCPERISPDRWQEVISDAETFLARWGSAAHSLGWTALDLFGVHPSAPGARFDVMGLLLLVQGGAVVALTADAATIRRKTGALLSCRRPVAPGAILISAVQP
jgi:hypothetical protein